MIIKTTSVVKENTPPVAVKWHPYADLFPWIEGKAFEELKADIAKNGVIEPIVFLGEYILDGRNRYTAARELGIEYPRVEYTGSDPLGFVLAKNLSRRHLSESQRGMVAAKLAKLPAHRPTENNSANLRTSDAATLLNVSARTVETARQVVNEGAPELIAAVESGAVSVAAAAEVAKLPKAKQKKVVADGKAKEVAKKAKEERAAERKAEQAKNDKAREATRAALPDAIKRGEAYKANGAVAGKKPTPAGVLTAEDRIAELEEANRVLEAENADLKARLKKFSEMEVEYKKGGFAEVIRGKDEVIAVQATRIERESADKVSWKRSSDMWRKRAEEAGWSNDIVIDLEPREARHG